MALPAGQYLGRLPSSTHTGISAPAPLGRTPWIDKSMERVWERITPHVDAGWLPELDESALKIVRGAAEPTFSVREYGCGYYGCVLPTQTAGLVLKVTSDASEAMFAQGAIQLGSWPAGIVRYHKVLALAGERRYRRSLFLLWRDEAFDIGQPSQEHDYALGSNLLTFKNLAQIVRRSVASSKNPQKILLESDRYAQWAAELVGETLGEENNRIYLSARYHWEWMAQLPPAQRVAFCVRACSYMSDMMANTYGQSSIGETLGFYIEAKILLADVHGGNVGRARVEGYAEPQVVITDPGQAVPLDLSWLSVPIKVV